MKILFVDNSPGIGGSVHQLASQVKGASALGARFHVIASKPELYQGLLPPDVPLQGLAYPPFREVFTQTGALYKPVLPGRFNKPFSLLAYRRFSSGVVPEFLKVLEGFKPDLVHINNLNLPNKVFADALAARKFPFAVCALMIRLFTRAELAFAGMADAVACVSGAVADCLMAASPVLKRDRMHVVESAIDVSRYGVPRNPVIRKDLGIPEDARVVLSLGRLIPWKGHDVLVRALGKIPNVWLLQAGGEEPSWRAEIDRMVAAAGLSGRVVFAGTRSDVPDLIAASDIVVHSSKFSRPEEGTVEAFGRVIVEGMAAGLPVIATAAGGAKEILEGSRAGRLVPPNNDAEMAEAVRYYLDDPKAAALAGEIGRREARKYNEDVLAEKLLSVYQAALAR